MPQVLEKPVAPKTTEATPLPRMRSIANVLIYAHDVAGRQLAAGIQDNRVVTVYGAVGHAVPVRVAFDKNDDGDSERSQAGYVAEQIVRELRSSGYAYVESKSINRGRGNPVEPFVFTVERTEPLQEWSESIGEWEIVKEADFPELHLPCPCCGNSACVLMPGNRVKGEKVVSEPWCRNCKGYLRLLPKHRLTETLEGGNS